MALNVRKSVINGFIDGNCCRFFKKLEFKTNLKVFYLNFKLNLTFKGC